MKKSTLVPFLAASSALAQGTFQNLDFESANSAGLTNQFVAFSDAFPGWTGYIGSSTNPASIAGYNFISGGSALITLITPTAPPQYANSVIDGTYTATIAAGLTGPTGALASASIAQVGTVPSNARSIRFLAFASFDYLTGSNYLTVSFNGVNVPCFPISGSAYTVRTYVGDVTPFAGLTGELRFTEQAAISEPVAVLDDIEFSTSVIPEPGVLTLSALGTLLLTWRFLRQPHTGLAT